MPDVAESVAKQDTTHGKGWKSRQMILADGGGSNRTVCIELDGDGQKIILDVRDAAGDRVVGLGSVSIDLTTLSDVADDAGGADVEVEFRVLRWKDASTCVEYQAVFLMSEPQIV